MLNLNDESQWRIHSFIQIDKAEYKTCTIYLVIEYSIFVQQMYWLQDKVFDFQCKRVRDGYMKNKYHILEK
jgi:hypothetical protein